MNFDLGFKEEVNIKNTVAKVKDADIVIFDGGVVFMGGGVCEPENHFIRQDCMVTNELYFNAPSREQIVKHVYELAGEEYSFEEFIAWDKLRGPH